MPNRENPMPRAVRARAAATAIGLVTSGGLLAICGVVLAFAHDVPGVLSGSMVVSGLICSVVFGYRARMNNPVANPVSDPHR